MNLFLILLKKSLLEFLESRQQVSDICLQERGDKKKIRLTTAMESEEHTNYAMHLLLQSFYFELYITQIFGGHDVTLANHLFLEAGEEAASSGAESEEFDSCSPDTQQ